MKASSPVELLKLQVDLGTALGSAPDLTTILDRVLEFAVAIEGIDCGGIYLLDEDSGELELAAHCGLSPEFIDATSRYGPELPESRMVMAATPVYRSKGGASSAAREICQREGLRAVAVVPVRHEGRVIGSLNLASHSHDQIPAPSRHTMEATAARLGGVINRFKFIARLRENEKNLRSLFDALDDFLFVLDAQGRIVQVNPVVEKRLGHSAEELVGKSVTALHPPERCDEAMAIIADMLAGKTSICPIPLMAKDGTLIPVETRGTLGQWEGRPSVFGVSRDISQRLKAEAAVRESEERYRTLVEAAQEGIGITDADENILFANQTFAEMLGYERDELVGLNLKALADEKEFAKFREQTKKRQKNESSRYETTMYTKSGRRRHISLAATPLHDADGAFAGTMGLLTDITERKRAEQALKEQSERNRLMLENMFDGWWLVNRQGRLADVNRSVCDMLGYSRQEMLSMSLKDIEVAETPEQIVKHLQKVATQGFDRFDTKMRRKDGEIRDVEVSVCCCDLGDREFCSAMSRDVTERKQAEQALHKERALLRRLLDLHERDRQLTAYEVHDGIAQHLTGALLNLEASDQLRQTDPEKAKGIFRTGCRLLGRSIEEARRLISGLRPPVLDESGIVVAISFLIHEHQRDGSPQIEFIRDVEFERLAPPLESALFRIAQESLTNACRHSRTDKIRIELVQTDHHVRLKVRDWGIGFSESKVKEDQFGLRGIRERARLLGGRVEIETAANRGTTIDVELPLIEPAPED